MTRTVKANLRELAARTTGLTAILRAAAGLVSDGKA
jgi:hypothetical protein